MYSTETDTGTGNHAYNEDSSTSLLESIDPVSHLAGAACSIANYFQEASHPHQISNLSPPCTFSNQQLAFNLNHNPSFRCLSVSDIAMKFNLPDLHTILTDYLKQASHTTTFTLSRQLIRSHTDLDFQVQQLCLDVWERF